jgi:hypothetical protein
MKVYVLCSQAGHYQGVFRSRGGAEDYAQALELTGYSIFTDVL